jgi:hypothetical protein
MGNKQKVSWYPSETLNIDEPLVWGVHGAVHNLTNFIKEKAEGLTLCPAGLMGHAIAYKGELLTISKQTTGCGKDRPVFLIRFVGPQGTIPLAVNHPANLKQAVNGFYADLYNACTGLWEVLQQQNETIAFANAGVILKRFGVNLLKAPKARKLPYITLTQR